VVHQSADLAWAIVFFALGRRLTAALGSHTLLLVALPWATLTAAIEYYAILPSLQPLVVMQVPFWTALGVHVTSGLLYPFYPRIRSLVTRRPAAPDRFARALRAGLTVGFVMLIGFELLARTDREPRWPFASSRQRTDEQRFLRHMTTHHAVGVELARLAAANGTDVAMRDLGRLMIANQQGELHILSRWWRSWVREPMPRMSYEEMAHIPGMPTAGTIDRLGIVQGSRFNAEFVPVMTAHHRGAVQMADEAWTAAADPRIRLLADSIRHAQERQIEAMAAILAGRTNAR
jgi:uncharacterized protein (DUF305 family)